VGEAANLFGLLLGDGFGLHGLGHGRRLSVETPWVRGTGRVV
jgi:hypothetical protein